MVMWQLSPELHQGWAGDSLRSFMELGPQLSPALDGKIGWSSWPESLDLDLSPSGAM
jgi:hypothetical protein